MSTPCRLICLIGVPGSGKSTLAQQFMQEVPERFWIATDTIRFQLFGDEAIQGPWPMVWEQVRFQFIQATAAIMAGQAREAIYDATNATQNQRKATTALARETGFSDITGIWVNTDVTICLERNRQRSRQVPDDVIWRMHQELMVTPPALADGFDRIVCSSDFWS